MHADEMLRKELEATLGQLEELAEQGASKSTRRLLARGFRHLIEKIARNNEERADRDEPS